MFLKMNFKKIFKMIFNNSIEFLSWNLKRPRDVNGEPTALLPCSIRPLLIEIYDVLKELVKEDDVKDLKTFIWRFTCSMNNSKKYYRKKGTMLEGKLSPLYENKYSIDTETDFNTAAMNPMLLSGEEMVDLDKMDLTWRLREENIKEERRTRRRVKMEKESESVDQSKSPQEPDDDDDTSINIGEDVSIEYFEEETPSI